MQIQHYSEEEAVFQLASSIIKVSLLTDVGGGGAVDAANLLLYLHSDRHNMIP